MDLKKMKIVVSLIFIILTTFNAQAYYSLMDTAELVEEGKFNSNIETQFITDGESGLNLIGRLDSRLTDETGYRIEAGFGVVDFNIAAFYKWAPIPDTHKQPAISISGGVSLARYKFGNETANDLSLRAHPIISKNFQMDFGQLTPYGGIPMGLRSVDGNTDFIAQLALGTQIKPREFKNMSFLGEIGFDLNEAFTYISLAFQLGIDPEEGIRFE